MKNSLLIGILFLFYMSKNVIAQNCLLNSLNFESNSIHWSLISNSYGTPNNLSALIVTPQFNTISSNPNAKWISHQSNWLMNGVINQPPDSAVFRYVLNTCSSDSIEFKFLFRRDNYGVIKIDNAIFFSELPSFDPNNYNIGTNINKKVLIDSGKHNFDVVLYQFYPYTGVNGAGFLISGNIASNQNSIILNTPNCANYTCCSNSNLEITGNTQLCKGQITTLSASGGNSYVWLDANNISLSNSNTISISPTTTTTYQIISTDGAGCSLSKNVRITVDTMPIITVSSANNISCAKASSVLSCNGFAQNYRWSPASLVSNAQSSTTIATPIVNTIFTVTASNAGCSTSQTVEVLLDSNYITNVAVPNAITANNDGLNDCFKILSKKQFIQFDCNIYNRLGQLVYKTNDPNFCWFAEINGQETTGNEVFFYHLKATTDCKEFFQKGDVTVIR